MAGKRLGTVFVELGLDSKEFTKGEAQILKQAQTTGIEIEKGWRALGSHSDMIFNAMRTNAQNAMNAIVSNAKSSEDEIRRAKEATAAKIKSIDEQQFGHQAGIIGTLKAHWVEATAAITAAWLAVNKATEYMDLGAKAMQVESSFKIMSDAAGVSSTKMVETMKKATRETIDDSDLMQKANKLMLAGYNPEQIERFSKAAITASRYMGVSISEGFDALGDAIANKTPKALNKLGAVTREQMKVVQDAISNGAESTVIFELAMANLELKTLQLKGTQDDATVSLQQFQAKTQETKEVLGKGLIVVLDAAYRSFEYLSGAALGCVSAYARYRALVYDVMGDEKKAAENRAVADDALGARNELIKKAGEAIFLESEAGARATNQEIKNAQDSVNAIMKKLKAYGEAKKAAEEARKLQEQWDDTARTLNAKIDSSGLDDLHKALIQNQLEADNLKDRFKNLPSKLKIEAYSTIDQARAAQDSDAVKKANEKTHKEFIDSVQREIDDYVKGEKEKEDAAKDRLNAERDIYKDLRGYAGDYYEATKRMIESQASGYRKQGIDQVAIAKWVAEELRKAEIVKLKASDDFFDGWKAGLMEMKNDAMTWGKAGYEIFKTFSENSRNVLSDVLFDGAKGQFKSFRDYMSSLSDAMLRKWTDIIAQMVVEWAMGIDKMKASEAGSSGMSSLISSGIGIIGSLFGGSSGTVTGTAYNADIAANFSGSGLGYANGAAFMNGQAMAFANGATFTNGIYDRPTLFPMARGAGLMGEDGPEAVMPLKRTASGKLGVAAERASSLTISMPMNVNGVSKKWADGLRSEIKDLVDKRVKDMM